MLMPYTFITKIFIDEIGVSVEDLEYDLGLSTPVGAVPTIVAKIRIEFRINFRESH